MNVFFEESGSFKVGSVLSRQGDAFQVELIGGRRVKVRAKDVLMEFETPNATDFLQQAQTLASEIDADFLWECAPEEEFYFSSLAKEYFGEQCTLIEQAGLLLCLHSLPIYFRRKGRGNYLRALREQVDIALQAVKRRQEQDRLKLFYQQELIAGRLPDVFKDKALSLLVKPDKNTIEYKALEAAAIEAGISQAQLLLSCQAIPSARVLHERGFLSKFFPKGKDFPKLPLPKLPEGLPVAEGQAFSIDDIKTTEIDDAFSVQILSDDRVRIGVHIAAPALGIAYQDEIDSVARERLSTVYMPGDKITMLPNETVEIFTLKEGGYRPVISLYLIINQISFEIIAQETRIESIFIADNLRYNELDHLITEETLSEEGAQYPYKKEIDILWPFAKFLHGKRQEARATYGLKPETQHHTDFNFYVEGEHITIVQRQRGLPLDLIVAELAILTNSTWAKVLHEHDIPAVYRVQMSFGHTYGPKRTRTQLQAAPHEGLGVAQYIWGTSPLRRYIDLVNQRQLVACIEHGVAAKLVAPFKPKDATLLGLVQDFDETYSAYIDYQRRMEHFWCLRWLMQENKKQVVATVIKNELVRLNEVPLLLHVPTLETFMRGTQVLLEVMSVDELNIEASVRLLRVWDTAAERSQEALLQKENEELKSSLSGDDATSE